VVGRFGTSVVRPSDLTLDPQGEGLR